MKTVFEPSNALEGHMLQDLLRQRGIAARLDGAQLQGGVGEIPVTGFVRLVVEDEDYPSARAVVDEWESTAVPDPIPVPPSRPAKGIRGALIGLALGIAGSYFFFRVPLPDGGIDHNRDGTLDERWFNSPNGSPIRTEIDRNFDDAVDHVFRFDDQGRVSLLEGDDDFDGTFESRFEFFRGSIELGKVDTDGDTYFDLRYHSKHGVLVSIDYLDPGLAQPIRVERYHLGVMTTADVDTDRDGRLDKRYTYSKLSEVIATDDIEPPK